MTSATHQTNRPFPANRSVDSSFHIRPIRHQKRISSTSAAEFYTASHSTVSFNQHFSPSSTHHLYPMNPPSEELLPSANNFNVFSTRELYPIESRSKESTTRTKPYRYALSCNYFSSCLFTFSSTFLILLLIPPHLRWIVQILLCKIMYTFGKMGLP